MCEKVMSHPGIIVRSQTRDSFATGFTFYRQRLDKAYSMTDCISMLAMRERNLADVLTHDHHFTQEGFTTLL